MSFKFQIKSFHIIKSALFIITLANHQLIQQKFSQLIEKIGIVQSNEFKEPISGSKNSFLVTTPPN